MRSLTVTLLLVVFVAACGASQPPPGDLSPDLPHVAPDIRGEITRILPPPDEGVPSILVEGPLDVDTRFERLVARITPQTRVFRDAAAGPVASSPEDLEVGLRVAVLIRGAVLETDPPIGDAAEVLILE
jgi:hypothetical protein